ncbi:uncharacterized protein LOC134570641 isoform X1 [Pelobates fuscus]|uniref:uncharacterized protein LOC134570641 isoform X1 n=1 Tax=Pelobates fuscus TaxID=191477 RepID=UPI002FE45B58
MDRLYESLREELRLFEDQVHKCRVNFDLPTLQRVLGLLSEVHKTQLDSWKNIENFVKDGNISGDQEGQFRDYLSWLLSYVDYLRSMKNSFDDHVVFPLCDNLYVNDEGDALPANGLQFPLAPTNIAATTRQLFHHRRTWALLLSARNHEQSQQIHGPSHSTLLMHCIQDIFEESLVTAKLANQWIFLHETYYKDNMHTQQAPQVCLSSEFQNGLPKERKNWSESRDIPEGDPEIQSQVKDMREYMMFLLWRAGRAEALELQVKDVNQKVQVLQGNVNDMQQLLPEEGPESREKVEKLKRQLDLERFHQQILNSDWQLELEARPSLIRQIDTVRERCDKLEAALGPRKEKREASPPDSLGAPSDTDWDSSSVFSQTSTRTSDVFTPQ